VQLGKVFAQMKPHNYHEISGQAMREGQRIEKFFVSLMRLKSSGINRTHNRRQGVS